VLGIPAGFVGGGLVEMSVTIQSRCESSGRGPSGRTRRLLTCNLSTVLPRSPSCFPTHEPPAPAPPVHDDFPRQGGAQAGGHARGPLDCAAAHLIEPGPDRRPHKGVEESKGSAGRIG
jgi:hypothetical protein